MKELPPVFGNFLAKYIQYWDGKLYQEHIFKLLEYAQPESFDDFCNNFLKPLQKLFCVSSIIWKARLLRSYTALLKYWVLHHWRLQNGQGRSVDNQKNMKHNEYVNENLFSEIIEVIKEMCGEEVASCFSLTHLPALAAYSKQCFKELEESSPNITRRLNRPVTYAALKENENVNF
ncbi:8175_t:CDS:2 [Paraglomus brasilianum]|uniref:8175_t:CDS:1 n=1 Tax=Paraglomus brasilianum TaxID=144538 RepID=A0A9N9GB57_9GLOM|nr:8175_t:CDS:2 [Paraglomus brasilianum]